uniref:Uncharacterized protein n=1 Tax=Oscillatoriales cyanobacterium SpSt-402 TaxID=2282168 RepID=A0A832M6T2_9CYAN
MSEKDELNRFLPDENLNNDKLSVEIPAEQHPVSPQKVPSGFDPMGEIQLRGQAYRGLAGGRAPWWILISGWFVFGSLVGVLIHIALTSPSLTIWIFVIIMAIPLLILWRGTTAKLSNKGSRER